MRVSIAFLSPDESVGFNIAVTMMLRVINMLVTTAEEWKGHPKVTFLFEKEHGTNVKSYKARILFSEQNHDPAERFLPSHQYIWYQIPEGFNTKEMFEYLASEVSKLAYAMTKGEVRSGPPIGSCLEITPNISFAMEFVYFGHETLHE